MTSPEDVPLVGDEDGEEETGFSSGENRTRFPVGRGAFLTVFPFFKVEARGFGRGGELEGKRVASLDSSCSAEFEAELEIALTEEGIGLTFLP